MKIMVLNDGETFTDIRGCQIVEIEPENITDEEIEESLNILNVDRGTCDGISFVGGFDSEGNFEIGDPRSNTEKSKIVLDRSHLPITKKQIFDILTSESFRRFYTSTATYSFQYYKKRGFNEASTSYMLENIERIFGVPYNG